MLRNTDLGVFRWTDACARLHISIGLDRYDNHRSYPPFFWVIEWLN